MKKHAYLIVANSNFEVLNACIRMLDFASNDFYLLFDKKSFPTVDKAEQKIVKPHNGVLKSLILKEVNWGGTRRLALC